LTATSQAAANQKAQHTWRDLKQTTHIFKTYLGKITETRKQQGTAMDRELDRELDR
jgi:hypothetical protein